MAEPADEALVTVAEFYYPGGTVKADLARARLQQEGIGAWIAEENLSGWFPHLTAAVGGIKLLVRASDASRAQAILLEEHAPDEMEIEDEDEPMDLEVADEAPPSDDEEVVCPECGSTDVVRKPFARSPTGILVIAITALLVVAVVVGALRPAVLVIPAVVTAGIAGASGRRYECWRCRYRWEKKD